MHILLNLIKPDAVTMFVLMLICLCGYCYPGYQSKVGLLWLLWLIGGVLAAIAWIVLIIA